MKRLRGKVAIVTGAALGLGRATAIRMAEEGASVALLDMLQAEGLALADELVARGLVACFWRCDVAKEAEVARVVGEWDRQEVDELGRLLEKLNTSIESLEGRPWPRATVRGRVDAGGR